MREVRIALYCAIVLHFARKIWSRCNRKPPSEDELLRMYNLDLEYFKESITKAVQIPVDRVFMKVSDRPFLGQIDTTTIGLVRRTPGLLTVPYVPKTQEPPSGDLPGVTKDGRIYGIETGNW